MNAESVRIRRVPDERGLFGRRARYDIEHTDESGTTHRTTTRTPGSVLADLLETRHPADLADWTTAADLAWDGGVGPWCRPGGVVIPATDPEPPAADPEAAARNAEAYLSRHRVDSLAGALPVWAAMLRATGMEEAADEVGQIGADVMLARSAEERSEIDDRVREVLSSASMRELAMTRGSLTEQTICRALLARVSAMV